MKRSSLADRFCPIARSASELADAWTFVILREIFLGNRKFDGLLLQTGMSPRSLTMRLDSLVESSVLERKPYSEAPPRHEYHLTEKGIDLWPVLIALKQWGEKWSGPWGRGGFPIKLTHIGHEHELSLQWVCKECGEPVDASSGTVHMSSKMKQERTLMANQRTPKVRKQAHG